MKTCLNEDLQPPSVLWDVYIPRQVAVLHVHTCIPPGPHVQSDAGLASRHRQRPAMICACKRYAHKPLQVSLPGPNKVRVKSDWTRQRYRSHCAHLRLVQSKNALYSQKKQNKKKTIQGFLLMAVAPSKGPPVCRGEATRIEPEQNPEERCYHCSSTDCYSDFQPPQQFSGPSGTFIKAGPM